MAGSALERLVTRARVFAGVTVPSRLGDAAARRRAALGAALLLLALLALLALGEPAGGETQVVVRASVVASRSALVDEEEGEAEGEDGEGAGASESFLQDDESPAEAPEVDALKSAQQQRQLEVKSAFVKFFESTRQEAEIRAFIGSYEAKYASLGILRSAVVGTTAEKRELRAYTVGARSAPAHMVVIGSEHGCEWSVPMYLTYVVTRLTQLYGINDEVTQVLDSVQLHVLPYVNPDGAAYSAAGKGHDARHYYKNRAPLRHRSSKGVDLREAWTDKQPQSEVLAVRELVQRLGGLPAAFVAVQCCGGAVAAPRNATCVTPSALDEQRSVGESVAVEMKVEHAYEFRLSPASRSEARSAIHWAQNVAGINLAFSLSAAAVPHAPTSKHKQRASSARKATVEVADKDLLTGAREVTKGVVAIGKHVAGRRAQRALCGSPIEAAEEAPAEEVAEAEDEAAADEDEVESESPPADEDAAGEEEEDAQPFADEEEEEADQEEEEEEGAGDLSGAAAPPRPLDRVAREAAALNSLRFARAVASRERLPESLARAAEDEPAPASFSAGRNDVANALRFARTAGVAAPLVQNLDQSTLDALDSARHFLYFAYGPDMLFELLQAVGVTSAVKVVNAQLDGYGVDFTYYSRKAWKSGVVDLYKLKRGHVQGVVYRVDKAQRELLDRHNLAASEDSHVAPVDVTVVDRQGNLYPCVTYRVPLKLPGDEVNGKFRRFRPSRQYRNCVIKGAKQQHLPEDYIEKRLRSIPPLFSDKIGSTSHRNERVGTLCDLESSS